MRLRRLFPRTAIRLRDIRFDWPVQNYALPKKPQHFLAKLAPIKMALLIAVELSALNDIEEPVRFEMIPH